MQWSYLIVNAITLPAFVFTCHMQVIKVWLAEVDAVLSRLCKALTHICLYKYRIYKTVHLQMREINAFYAYMGIRINLYAQLCYLYLIADWGPPSKYLWSII